MAKTKNKDDLMEDLFFTVVGGLTSRLRTGEATPQDFKNAIQFLKDNSITVAPTKGPNDLMAGLLAELPFNEEDLQ